MNRSRRTILIFSASLAVTRLTFADTTHLSPDDPAAKAVGYVEDAGKVDKARYPKFVDGQKCTGCSLFQGKLTDAWGGCLVFGNKQVAGPGWCTSYGNL
jgi:hypothetical protein